MAENSILTLKEYKAQIDELQKSIGDLENGTEKYGKLLNSTVGTLDSNIKQLSQQKQALNDLKQQYKEGEITLEKYMKGERELKVSMGELNKQINIQQKLANASNGSYNDLSQTLSLLKNAYKQLNEEEKASTGGKEMAKDIQTLDEYLKQTAGSMGEFQRNVGNYEGATVSLKAQLKDLQAQMAQMLSNGAKPTDEAFIKLAQDAGKIKDALNDAAAATKQYANDTKGMAAVLDVAQTGVAVFGAWKGAMSLFGAESEEATKVIQTMTTVTTILNSVQQINKALFDNSTTTYRLFHRVLQAVGLEQKVNTVATEAHTGAMVADTVATTEATVATNLFKKALISTGIGAIVVLIGTLIAHFDDIAKMAKKAGQAITDFLGITSEEERAAKKAAEAEKERAKELKDAADQIFSSYTDEISQLLLLDQTINDVTKSDEERIKAMKKVNELTGQQIFDLKNVRGELENTNNAVKAYVENLLKQAQVQALSQKYANVYMTMLEAQRAIEAARAKGNEATVAIFSTAVAAGEAELNKLKGEIENVIGEMKKYETYKPEKDEPKKKKGSGETPEQKKEAEAVAELVRAQEALNKELELNLNIQRELNEIDDKLSPREKAEEEVEAIELEIKAQQDLQKVYKAASQDAMLSAKKREEYAEKVNEVELKIKSLNASKQIQIEKNRIAEEERLRNKNLDDIVKYHNDRLAEDEKDWNDQKEALAKQYINKEITYKEYNERLKEIEANQRLQRLQEEEIFQSLKFDLADAALNKLIEENIDPETQKYKDAYKEREESLKAHLKAVEDLNKESINKQVKDASKAQDNWWTEFMAKNEKWLKPTKGFTVAMGNLFESVSEMLEEDIAQREKNGEATKEQLKDEFEAMKAFQISTAVIDGVLGAAGVFAKDMSTYGTPFGPFIGGIDSAAVLATTAAQIQKIANRKYDDKSSDVGGSASSASASPSISSIQMQPLLNEQADLNSLQTIQTQNSLQTVDNRVYIVESDIQESNNRVEVREKNVTF